MNDKLPFILAIGMAIAAAALFMYDYNGNQPISMAEGKLEDVSESSQQTYVPPQNIYLPKMMFLVVKDIDKPAISRCKNMTYRIVDTFSRHKNSIFVRSDERLLTLARIVYDECIDVVLVTYKEGI